MEKKKFLIVNSAGTKKMNVILYLDVELTNCICQDGGMRGGFGGGHLRNSVQRAGFLPPDEGYG